MTEERQEKNRKNTERLNEIILWSIENKSLWLRLCYGDIEQGITTQQLSELIDNCLHLGFMEIYYLVLTKIADVVNIGADMEQIKQFLGICVDGDLTLDMDRISKAIQQTGKNTNESAM